MCKLDACFMAMDDLTPLPPMLQEYSLVRPLIPQDNSDFACELIYVRIFVINTLDFGEGFLHKITIST